MAKDLDVIQTGRLILRGIGEGDAPEIVEWRSDPDAYRFFKSPHKITLREHTDWYRDRYLFNENRFDWMAVERETGRKIGVFGLVRDGGTAEVNYILSPDARHRGYAREAVERLMQYARERWQVERILAEIHRDNKASVALAERLGFTVLSSEGEFIIYVVEG